MTQNPTIKVALMVNIEPDSKLFELVQAASRIGLQVMCLKNAGKSIPKALQTIYWEADSKLKMALIDQFGFSFPIDNLGWNSEEYLDDTEHLILLAPEG